MACEKCNDGIVFTRCCSGLAEMCGCGGYPVQATNCKDCNPENRDPTDPDVVEMVQYVEWVD